MKVRRSAVGLALLGLVVSVALFGTAATGQATSQTVRATLICDPPAVKPGKTVGCILTVTNFGTNTANQTVVAETVPGGKFLSAVSSPSCTGAGTEAGTDTLNCNIGKLTALGTAGSSFTATYELQVPSTSGQLVQTFLGKFSPKPNSRTNDEFQSNPVQTKLDPNPNFDATFSDAATDPGVQTDAISTGNPYSTGATLGDTTGFAVGLSVLERAPSTHAEAAALCPGGCFGGQVIQFDITPLLPDGPNPYPASFQLTIKVYVGPGVKESDINVRHIPTGSSTATPVLACSDPQPDPPIDCIASKTIDPSTKIATIVITGPGTGNGGWGNSGQS